MWGVLVRNLPSGSESAKKRIPHHKTATEKRKDSEIWLLAESSETKLHMKRKEFIIFIHQKEKRVHNFERLIDVVLGKSK